MPLRSTLSLTNEQAAIVAHDRGPALVYAVAGSGKTTAMVHRIARLVSDRVFAPHHILATSFNKDANRQIQAALKAWPACDTVQVRTLHALGYVLVRSACRRGHLAHLDLEASRRGVEHNARRILYTTLSAARRRNESYQNELGGLDEEDFLAYVSACKGALAYPEERWAQLPLDARRQATVAEAPRDRTWYLELYALYETVRLEQGLLTFDDMLMSGWEVLVRHPDLLATVRNQYQCVLVDEFQDVNRAQAEILDLLVAPHGNYMAIGDDDQTIYEWRGASQHHFLSFQQRYRAKIYQLTENFRSRAVHIALANQVIRFNAKRQPKEIRLTQGFDGVATLCGSADYAAMGECIAAQVAEAIEAGHKATDIAILVRLYAQTAPIEQALAGRRIPYRIVGGVPYYERPEITAFLNYIRLANWERNLRNGEGVRAGDQQRLMGLWSSVYNRPLRYISADLADQVMGGVLRQGRPFAALLQQVASAASDKVGGRMVKLAEDLTWLSNRLDTPAAKVLAQLDERLEFAESLRQHHGAEAAGRLMGKAVAGLAAYAEAKGAVSHFMDHLERLAQEAEKSGKRRDSVTLTTIFRAKGLEWPVVFVPNCNQGILPMADPERLEEERRLLYVAITRARNELYLHHVNDDPMSQFLQESAAETIIEAVNEMRHALQRDPRQWGPADFAAIGINARRLGFDNYLMQWWRPDEGYRLLVAQAMLAFFNFARAQGYWDAMQVGQQEVRFWQRAAGRKRMANLELEGVIELLEQLQDIYERERARNAA